MNSIILDDIYYSYEESSPVFEGHSLVLSSSSRTGLYGIIGPSGTGKSTFLSILGGQLNPQRGTVTIMGQNIYTLDDKKRRSLIAVQMQSSSALRGALRYNLVFGIPESMNEYSDEELIYVLQSVGLWHLFEKREGLSTLIGEGGMNLSGGQRQRLNFAGLYLRAQYFQPAVVLIDEPTSSLDEVSEKAITEMIDSLSKRSLTLVVAHRLMTLQNAQGILDTSLLSQMKELSFDSRDHLSRKSSYYRDLMLGKEQLEE